MGIRGVLLSIEEDLAAFDDWCVAQVETLWVWFAVWC